MKSSPHLTFAGQCEAAFRFYERLFGGKHLMLLPYGESPLADQVAPQWRAKILHASLTLGDTALLGADVRPEQYDKPRGFYVLVSVDDPVTAERMFAALAEDGEVHMPLQKTFWSPRFGAVVDRFGIPWEVSCEQAPGAG